MQKRLTITIDEAIYEGLYNVIGRGNIGRFLEGLARPYVSATDVEQAYREMAADSVREIETSEWTESLAGDAFDETR